MLAQAHAPDAPVDQDVDPNVEVVEVTPDGAVIAHAAPPPG